MNPVHKMACFTLHGVACVLVQQLFKFVTLFAVQSGRRPILRLIAHHDLYDNYVNWSLAPVPKMIGQFFSGMNGSQARLIKVDFNT